MSLSFQQPLDSYLQGVGRVCLNPKYFLATGYSSWRWHWDATVAIPVVPVAVNVIINFQHHRVGIWCLLRFKSVDALEDLV